MKPLTEWMREDSRHEYLIASISILLIFSPLVVRFFLTETPSTHIIAVVLCSVLSMIALILIVKVSMFVRKPLQTFLKRGQYSPLSEKEKPELLEWAGFTAHLLGIKNLRIYVTDEPVYSFSGVDGSDRVIVLSRDYLDSLSNGGLRAVVLHEFCHLRTDGRVAALATTSYRTLVVPLFLTLCLLMGMGAFVMEAGLLGFILLFGTVLGMYGLNPPPENQHVFFQQREMYADCFAASLMSRVADLIAVLKLSLNLELKRRLAEELRVAPLFFFDPFDRRGIGEELHPLLMKVEYVDEVTHPSIAERISLLHLLDRFLKHRIVFEVVKPLGLLGFRSFSFHTRKKPSIFQTSFGKHAVAVDQKTFGLIRKVLAKYDRKRMGFKEISEELSSQLQSEAMSEGIFSKIVWVLKRIDRKLSSYDEHQFKRPLYASSSTTSLYSRLFFFDFFVVFCVLLQTGHLKINV